MKRNGFGFGERSSYLTFQPHLTPFAQTRFRTENVEFVHTASFPCDGFSSYDFPADLTSHLQALNEKTILNYIKIIGKNEVENLG